MALAAGCGGKPPSLGAVEWRLELRPSVSGAYETLSVFASFKDEDGSEDLETIWLSHDASELSWRLGSAEWTRKTEGTDEWLGGSGLAMPDYGPLPRGEYRFVAADLSGQRAERSFWVEGDFPAIAAPAVSALPGERSVAVKSACPETLILAYDAAGTFLASAAAPGGRESLSAIFPPDTAGRCAELAAYGYDPARRMGAFSRRKKAR